MIGINLNFNMGGMFGGMGGVMGGIMGGGQNPVSQMMMASQMMGGGCCSPMGGSGMDMMNGMNMMGGMPGCFSPMLGNNLGNFLGCQGMEGGMGMGGQNLMQMMMQLMMMMMQMMMTMMGGQSQQMMGGMGGMGGMPGMGGMGGMGGFMPSLGNFLGIPGGAGGAGGPGGAGDVGNVGGTPGAGGVNLSPHGNWGGCEGPVKELAGLTGLQITSGKRDRRNTASGGVSDHWTGNTNAYAVDLGWGSSQPTGRSDQAASQIVSALGGPANWGQRGGVFSKTINGIRYQVIYRSNVGGNHFNHIHLGAKRVG